jgi:hypothetical protein
VLLDLGWPHHIFATVGNFGHCGRRVDISRPLLSMADSCRRRCHRRRRRPPPKSMAVIRKPSYGCRIHTDTRQRAHATSISPCWRDRAASQPQRRGQGMAGTVMRHDQQGSAPPWASRCSGRSRARTDRHAPVLGVQRRCRNSRSRSRVLFLMHSATVLE